MRFWPVTGFRWWTNEAIRLPAGRHRRRAALHAFVLSDSVPGQVLLLKSGVPRQRSAETPGQAPDFTDATDFSDPLQTDTLRFGGTQR